MDDPLQQIADVVIRATCAETPEIQQETIKKYFTRNVEFMHPLCSSRNRNALLGIYRWYRVMSPNIDLHVNNIVYDDRNHILLLDMMQTFHIRLNPFGGYPARLLARVTLREEDGKFYIAKQEDFYHPQDLLALVIPPLIPIQRFVFLIAGFLCGVYAWMAAQLGYWRPKRKSA